MTSESRNKLKKFNDRVIAVEKFFVVCLLAIMCILNTIALFLRAFTGISFLWTEPVTLLLFCWITFIGAAVVFHNNEYIVVDFVVNRFFPDYRRGINICSDILVIAFLLFIILEMPGLLATQTHKIEILPLPTLVISLPILICVLNVILHFIHQLWDSLDPTSRSFGKEA